MLRFTWTDLDVMVTSVGGTRIQDGISTHTSVSVDVDIERVSADVAYIAVDPASYDVRDGSLGLTGDEDSAFGLGGFDDGHAAIQRAIALGTPMIIAERYDAGWDIPADISVYVVANAVELLAALARKAIADNDLVVISITGSIGKTTTAYTIWRMLRDLKVCQAVLFDRTRTTTLGLSLDILRAPLVRHAVIVCEMQSDALGQVASLMRVAPPKIAVVTRLTDAHLAKFGKIEHIVEEKIGSLSSVIPNPAAIIVNADDPLQANFQWEGISDQLVWYGTALGAADVEVVFVSVAGERWTWRLIVGGKEHIIKLRRAGLHHGFACAAALCVAKVMNLAIEDACRILETVPPAPGRADLFRGVSGNTVIVDAYNAGANSMLNALDILSRLDCRKRIAVLGSLLELGPNCRTEHERVGRGIGDTIDFLVTIGEAARIIATTAVAAGFDSDKIRSYESVEGFIQDIDLVGADGSSAILLKGSGAMRLERLAPYFLGTRVH